MSTSIMLFILFITFPIWALLVFVVWFLISGIFCWLIGMPITFSSNDVVIAKYRWFKRIY